MLKYLAIGLLALFASLDVTISGGDPRPVGCDRVQMGRGGANPPPMGCNSRVRMGPGGGAPHPVSCARAR